MSWPTITYGKVWQDDCATLTPLYTWTEKGTGDGDTATMTVLYGDYFDLYMDVAGGDKSVYWEYPDSGGANNLSINTSLWPVGIFRFKCSNASVKAKIVGVFSDANTQTWLAETNEESWTYGTIDLTASKTLDHLQLYATSAVGHVYYDFASVLQGIFEFPNANLVELILPQPRKANIPIPGKDGVAPQNLGSEPARVRIAADMDVHSTTWNYGKVFDYISHDLSNDLWQWVTLPAHKRQFKVSLADSVRLPFEDGKLRLELLLEEYKLADARAFENPPERFGHTT